MTLVDSADSILMLYAYAGVPDKAFALFEKAPVAGEDRPGSIERIVSGSGARDSPRIDPGDIPQDEPEPERPVKKTKGNSGDADIEGLPELHHASLPEAGDDSQTSRRKLRVKRHTMSGLSIALTLISILVAFRYARLFQFSNEKVDSFHIQHIAHYYHGSYWRKLCTLSARGG